MGCCGKSDALYRLHIDFIDIFPEAHTLYTKLEGNKEDILFHNCSLDMPLHLSVVKASGATTSITVAPSTSKVSKLRCLHEIKSANGWSHFRILKYTKIYE